jgi:hypothetical protein
LEPGGIQAFGDPFPVGPPGCIAGVSQIFLNASLSVVGAVVPKKYTSQSPDEPKTKNIPIEVTDAGITKLVKYQLY